MSHKKSLRTLLPSSISHLSSPAARDLSKIVLGFPQDLAFNQWNDSKNYRHLLLTDDKQSTSKVATYHVVKIVDGIVYDHK